MWKTILPFKFRCADVAASCGRCVPFCGTLVFLHVCTLIQLKAGNNAVLHVVEEKVHGGRYNPSLDTTKPFLMSTAR